MKYMYVSKRILGPLLAGGLLAAAAMPAGAVDLTTPDGNWTFSVNGNVNVDYIFSNCQSPGSAVGVGGGLTCVGSASGSNVSNIGNGLLPAAITFGIKTTQAGYDIAAHFGFYPGIATNDGGSPNLQNNSFNGSSNTALGTTGLDIRQVYLTFGNKDMGTFLFGRQIGLFGADVILNDMTLPGVGAPGSAAGATPSNTTLGGIGFGYIYTDWLAQMDWTTPDFSGFNFTVGIFDPLNSLTEPCITLPSGIVQCAAVQPKKAPGFHGKATYTTSFSDTTKLYVSVAGLSQKQYYVDLGGTPYDYNGNAIDIFAKLDVADLSVFGYYYHGDGVGTTALFLLGSFGDGNTRKSDGYMAQVTYKLGSVKLGVNYGVSKLDYANGADRAADPFGTLLWKNEKVTVGAYWSLTKNLTLLGEVSHTKSENQAGGDNSANTFNVGAFVGF